MIKELSDIGKISKDQAIQLANNVITKNSKMSIVPKLIYEISWYCDEVAKMKDNEEFKKSLLSALLEFSSKFNVNFFN